MKKYLKLLSKIGVLTLLLFLTSCYYNEIDETQLVTDDVSFSLDIQPILNDNCIACHNGTQSPNLTEGNAYTSLTSIPGGIVPGDAAGSELVEMLEHDPNNPNPMPPSGPMSAIKINLIKDWIDQGALNN